MSKSEMTDIEKKNRVSRIEKEIAALYALMTVVVLAIVLLYPAFQFFWLAIGLWVLCTVVSADILYLLYRKRRDNADDTST